MKTRNLYSLAALAAFLFTFGSFDAYGQAVSLTALLEQAASASPTEAYRLARRARRYPVADYDEAARTRLAALLQPGGPHRKEWVLLAGYAGLEAPLRALLEAPGLPAELLPNVQLALARCGDAALARRLARNARAMPLNDAFIFQTAPALAYARRPETVGVLIDRLMEDETGCTPADAETAGRIPCAYRLLEILAPIVVDFPLALDPDTGDLQTQNYAEALAQARYWLGQRNGRVALRTDFY